MKFQVFLLLIHIDLIFGNSGRLNEEENEQRLKTCGVEPIPTPSTNASLIPINKSIPWIWMFYSTFPNIKDHSAAYRISSRHFITFSNTILNMNLEWHHNGKSFESNCTIDGLHEEVPEDVIKQLKITPLNCYGSKEKDCLDKTLTASRAYLVPFCDVYTKQNSKFSYSLMVVEVGNNSGEPTVCLPENKKRVSRGEHINMYRLNDTIVRHCVVELRFLYRRLLDTSPPIPKNGSQKILVKKFDGKSALIAMTATDLPGMKNERLLRLLHYRKNICSLVGVCQVESKSSETTTTTKAPTALITTRKITTLPSTTSNVPSTRNKLPTTTSEAFTTSESTSTPQETSTNSAISLEAKTTTSKTSESTMSSSTESESSTMTSSKPTKESLTSKPTQKTSTSKKPEEEYDYEEYEEWDEEKSDALKMDDSLLYEDENVGNGGEYKKNKNILELFFVVVFVWALLE